MNYLAHAWILPADDPDLVLGSALPDLAGTYDRRSPRLAGDAALRLESEGLTSLARGIRAHHAADRSFHELDAFREGCAELRPLAARLNAGGARVRGFFFVHLVLEVLLDAALLERAPALARDFYEALDAAALRGERAARALGSPRDAGGFGVFCGRFVEARFLEDYATDAGVARRVAQALGRARQDLGPARALLEAELPLAREAVRSRTDALTLGPRRAVERVLGPGGWPS